MARIEDIVNLVEDRNLRGQILSEIKKLKKTKQWGLVHEIHDEHICLPGAPIVEGVWVTRIDEEHYKDYRVEKVDGENVIISLLGEEDEEPIEVSISQLARLVRFGQDDIHLSLEKSEFVNRGGEVTHVAIEGDNFLALQLLAFSHAGKIDLIYIDPPYNTGDDKGAWKYNNKIVGKSDQYKHSKWLSFMRRRLKLAKHLLSDDGVLVITIDEHEVHHLGMLLEESDMFRGHECHMVTININPKGLGNENNLCRVEEFAFFIFPKKKVKELNELEKDLTVDTRYFLKQIADSGGKPGLISVAKSLVKKIEEGPRKESYLWGDQYCKNEEEFHKILHKTKKDDLLNRLNNILLQGDVFNPWDTLLRRGTGSQTHERPSMCYPIAVDSKTKKIVGIGKSMKERHDWEAHDPRYSELKVPKKEKIDGHSVIWPIRKNGKLGVWALGKESLLEHNSLGFLRVAKFNPETSRGVIHRVSEKAQKMLDNGKISIEGNRELGEAIFNIPEEHRYMTKRPKRIWSQRSHNADTHGDALLQAFLEDKSFNNPKSLYAVMDTVDLVLRDKTNAKVLDFFGGSGTTLHAVAALNQKDGGQRQCIIVSNNEVTVGPEKNKIHEDGHYIGSPEFEKLGIFRNVTLPRCKAAVTGESPKGNPIQGDYHSDYLPDRSYSNGFEQSVNFLKITPKSIDDFTLADSLEEYTSLIWLASGGVGLDSNIDKLEGFRVATESNFAILENPIRVKELLASINDNSSISHICVATSSETEFREVRKLLPNRFECWQFPTDYLQHWKRMNRRRL
jgi:adenine-specific DNA-methyltransferase